jgi:hypothetical protein
MPRTQQNCRISTTLTSRELNEDPPPAISQLQKLRTFRTRLHPLLYSKNLSGFKLFACPDCI